MIGYSSLPLESPEVLTQKLDKNRRAESVLRDTFEAFHLARKDGLRLQEVEGRVPASSSCSSSSSGHIQLPPFDTSLSTSVSSRSLSGDLSGSSTSTRGATLDMDLPFSETRSKYFSSVSSNQVMEQFMRSTKKRVVTEDGSKRSRNDSGCVIMKDVTYPKLLRVKASTGHFGGTTKRQRLETIVLE